MSDRERLSTAQWQVAIRTLTDLLAQQMRKPGGISIENLPNQLRMAVDEQGRHGDYGAARLLEQWAVLVTQPIEEWD